MKIATAILGLTVLEVAEIPDLGILNGSRRSGEVVGLLNRSERLIVTSGKHGFVRQRFTLSHEVAHYVLHDQMVEHRELATNCSVDRSRKSAQERDADIFGAELLMPSRLVREEFKARFNGIVDGTDKHQGLFYSLTVQGTNLNHDQFFGSNPRYRAIQLAKARWCYGRQIISMCELFRVSPTAMAIQEIDVGVVK